VNVQVRYALADGVVDCDERSLGAHRVANRPRKLLRSLKNGRDQGRRQIRQGFIVIARNEEGVSGKQRPGIQECEGMIVF